MHLGPELCHPSGRMMLLHLRHRDPRGGALGRIIQHGRCRRGVLVGDELGNLLVHS